MAETAEDGRVPNWDLGTGLVLLRIVAGLTQEDLAKASGVRASSIFVVESPTGLTTLSEGKSSQDRMADHERRARVGAGSPFPNSWIAQV